MDEKREVSSTVLARVWVERVNSVGCWDGLAGFLLVRGRCIQWLDSRSVLHTAVPE